MEPICHHCGKSILDNRGTFWIKGTGGIFARGVYPSTIVCSHWGECANKVGKEFAKICPDAEGQSWFWGHLPFYEEVESTSNSNRFIYVLKSGTYYKIGIAKDVAERLRNLQTGNPIEIALVSASFFENAPRFETRLHEAFSDYRTRGEWFELPPGKLEELIAILENKDFIDQVPPFDNIVYYSPGSRVRWRNQPGVVHSLVVKSYKYEVGYNITLDTQDCRDEPEVTNSGYDELVLEETGMPSTEGYEVEPVDPDISEDGKTFFTLKELYVSKQSADQGKVK
ncbi:MAG: GIY-YIG nuclease family protein [Coleofasciculus sp. Co-bin14]|nr:GIY-YIG nuclease family protein [Coleofasciculus sp. Co-bin14]